MDIKALEETIRTKLQTVEHPTFRRNLIDLGMFDGVEQDGEKIRLKLKSPDSDRKTQITLEATIRGLLKDDIPGSLKIRFETDESLVPQEETNKPRGVKNIIAVGSGKGGVGKSTVSVNLACTLAQKGQKVGLLAADIYGPSVGKLVGLEGKKPLQGDGERKIEPLQAHGVKVISFSFLLAPEQPVVWRGPMLGKALEQFLFEVQWDDLDYLIIDLPPGTGDTQLSLAQLIDVDGAVIVTTPQNVALNDAQRAVSMFRQVKIPVVGVIENMSEFICPHCGKASHIFSKNGGDAFSKKFKLRHLGSVPLQQEIMESGETGKPIVVADPKGPVAEAYGKICDGMVVEVEQYKF